MRTRKTIHTTGTRLLRHWRLSSPLLASRLRMRTWIRATVGMITRVPPQCMSLANDTTELRERNESVADAAAPSSRRSAISRAITAWTGAS